MTQALAILMLILAAITAFVLLVVFILVPLFRGIGWAIASLFQAAGWFIAHIFEFIGGMIGDALRSIGACLAMFALAPLALLNVIIGRWSAASHFAESVKRECMVAGGCLYRVLVHRPLKLFWLHGLLEGIEQRVPEAMYAAPGSDTPGRRTGQFDGYTIVGSLAGGGSGGKLYIARPDDHKRERLVGRPEHVVIKAFALSEGSSLPQIVRESRALECAKQLGHVLDHGMDEHRFFYVMPYHPGDHLGIITRQLHAESDGALSARQLGAAMSYIRDLLATLRLYHEGGLWHKDVKPENVIVHDGRAHLVDLGLVTPLKSAMTLTTHGTEYFRDPEMVRQALRGVKVHQVDGAKFDIYAVGAVLYFMIENTFPAHGGLSRFSKKSPEALRWIIRRAMAEYQQRYATAAIMLADLEVVANAHDPFAVTPAQLPSMRSGDAQEVEDLELQTQSPQVASVAAAASPVPPREPAGAVAPIGRPRLRVTNWWTGQYVIEDDGTGRQPPSFTRPPAYGPRPSAREQVRAARQRAHDLRSRVSTRRHKVGLERHPSPMLGFLVLCFLLGGGYLLGSYMLNRPAKVAGNGEVRAAQASVNSSGNHAATAATSLGRPVLLIVDADDPQAARRLGPVQHTVTRYAQQDYHIVNHPGMDHDHLRQLINDWQSAGDGKLDEQFEDILAEHDLYGFLHIKVTGDGASPRISETLIRSGRKGAELRRRASDDAAAAVPALPFLLINDHPAKADPRVQERVDRLVADYRQRGWTVLTDDDAEVAVRKAMPAGVMEAGDDLPPRLRQALAERELGGILRIDARPGEGEPHERVRMTELKPQMNTDEHG